MRQIALGTAVTGLITLLSTAAWAQEPARPRIETTTALAGVSLAAPAATRAQDPGDPMRNFTFSFGSDFPSDYIFRGILQESEGFIAQPWVDFGYSFSDAVSLNVGFWNSMHTSDFTGYYEADPYASISFASGNWAFSVLYTLYTSPSDSFLNVHELAFGVSQDSAVAPSFTVAVELDNAGCECSGNTYLEIGVEPGIPTGGPVSVSIPVVAGFSIKDYYTTFDEETFESENAFFGYVKAGVAVGVELSGGWEVHGGVDVYFFGDPLRGQFDTDSRARAVATFGVSFTY